MKENKITIDVFEENDIKIEANCQFGSHYQLDSNKDYLITSNSLMLSKTISSVKTLRISKNSIGEIESLNIGILTFIFR